MIFHITQRKTWETARVSKEYRSETLDTQGFIHCSTSEQIVSVANGFYRGQRGLVLLCIDSDKLRTGSALRYEPPEPVAEGESLGDSVRHEDLFPHIYGPINIDAVTAVLDFEPEADGLFALPREIASRG